MMETEELKKKREKRKQEKQEMKIIEFMTRHYIRSTYHLPMLCLSLLPLI